MRAVWSSWVAATSVTEDATSLALFRVAMGSGALVTVGSVVLTGLVPVIWIDAGDGGLASLDDGTWLIAQLGGPTPRVTWSMVAVSVVSSLLLTLGIGGRLCALGSLLSTSSLVYLNPEAGGAYDQLLTNGLWLCVLGGGGATLSVDAWRRTGRWWPDAQVVAFPRWLVAFQLVLMYCMTGLQKVSVSWVPGGEASALYYILQQPSFHRVDMSWVAHIFPLTQLGTLVTYLWEVTSPLWLLALWWSTGRRTGLAGWSNRLGVRWVYFGVGLAMHALVAVTMDVGPFGYVSLGFYTAMLHPQEWRRGWSRLASGDVPRECVVESSQRP